MTPRYKPLAMSTLAARPLPALPSVPPLPPPSDFGARLAELGVSLPAATLERVGAYLALLLAMNEQLNLTAITDPEGAWTRHALDAFALVPLLAQVPAGGRLLDVGSGGGVPGLVLAIARPDLQVTLIEATQKKAAFLEAVVKALGLERVSVLAERAEQLATTSLARSFDVVTARAVAKLAQLLPWTAPFARRGGALLLVKGARADAELDEARRVLARFRCQHERTVQTPTGRVVVLTVGG